MAEVCEKSVNISLPISGVCLTVKLFSPWMSCSWMKYLAVMKTCCMRSFLSRNLCKRNPPKSVFTSKCGSNVCATIRILKHQLKQDAWRCLSHCASIIIQIALISAGKNPTGWFFCHYYYLLFIPLQVQLTFDSVGKLAANLSKLLACVHLGQEPSFCAHCSIRPIYSVETLHQSELQ